MQYLRKRDCPRWAAWLAPAALVAGLAACGGGAGTGTTAATNAAATSATTKPLRSGPVSPPLPTKYTPVILGPNAWGYRKAVNASGQVVYHQWDGSRGVVRFRSGETTQTVDTSGAASGLIYSDSYGIALSDSGRVAGGTNGHMADYGWRQSAWSWNSADATLTLLAPSSPYSWPQDQNGSGEILGGSSSGNLSWSPTAGLRMLPSVSGYLFSINDSGVIAGHSWSGSTYVATTWTPTGTSTWSANALSTPANHQSLAYSINSTGAVAGYTYDWSTGEHRAATWSAGTRNDLGSLPGDSYSYADLVSDSGHVLGQSWGSSYWRRFVWSPTNGMTEIGDAAANKPAYPHLLNKWGHAAGWGYDQTKPYWQYGFVWSEADGLVDLNTRIDNPPAGFHVWYVYSIGDGGHILAATTSGLALLVPGAMSVAPPVIGPISANDPVPVGTSVAVGASFTDPDASDTHTASWTWDDGSTTTAGIVSESNGAGTVGGAHTFSAAGVYNVSLTVTDSTGKPATVSRQVVVYDPSAGFVTGGGWIMSPAGAYKQDETLAGRATFGFVSKYQKGAVKPSGKTEFQFQAAKLNFHSSDYDWLVVAGARAQYKGTGTINGQPGYKFLLTAVDGQVTGGGGSDRFRIKIWHYDAAAETDVVDYDNQLDTTTDGTVSEGTAIGGGSIQIHK